MKEREVVFNEQITALMDNIEKVIVGKRDVIELIVATMLTGGHVLIEDVPGVGKTQMVSAFASSCKGDFGRIQLTPDVMPTDITGFTMININTHETEFKKGIAFCNFLLADEINRASPKVQSALLEVMEEGQISIDGNTYVLPKPFMVLATQNPVETYGTYHLPEAQMDRFMIKISIGYPDKSEELDILKRFEKKISSKSLESVITCDDIVQISAMANEVHCSEAISKYIIDITELTRKVDYIKLGVSPRGSIALYQMAKSYAFVKGRNYVVPDDIKELAPYVLAHRIILTSKGKSMVIDNIGAINKILDSVTVPIE